MRQGWREEFSDLLAEKNVTINSSAFTSKFKRTITKRSMKRGTISPVSEIHIKGKNQD